MHESRFQISICVTICGPSPTVSIWSFSWRFWRFSNFTSANVNLSGEHFYACGGYDSGRCDPIANCERFSFKERKWELVPEKMPVPVSGAAAVSIGQCLYVIGGRGRRTKWESEVKDVIQCYDTVDRRWMVLTPMSEARESASAVALPSGRILITGGWSADLSFHGNETILSTCELYNPGTDSWRFVAPMNKPRDGHCIVAWRDGAVVVGGLKKIHPGEVGLDELTKERRSMEQWDERTDQWTVLPGKLPERICGFSTIFL